MKNNGSRKDNTRNNLSDSRVVADTASYLVPERVTALLQHVARSMAGYQGNRTSVSDIHRGNFSLDRIGRTENRKTQEKKIIIPLAYLFRPIVK